MHPELGRAVRRPDPGRQGLPVIFTETPLAGRLRHRARAARGRAGLLRPHVVLRGSSRPAASTPASPSAASRSTSGRAPCAACTTRCRPHAETKIVRCTRGAIYDVIIDLRPDSPTFTAALSRSILTRGQPEDAVRARRASPTASRRSRTTPRSSTRCRSSTAPEHARGVRWDDPAFGISLAGRRARSSPSGTGRYPDFRPRWRHAGPMTHRRAPRGPSTAPTLGQRAVRLRRATSTRSAGASPATASARRCGVCSEQLPARASTRSRPARRCSTGRCRGSGTSATPG